MQVEHIMSQPRQAVCYPVAAHPGIDDLIAVARAVEATLQPGGIRLIGRRRIAGGQAVAQANDHRPAIQHYIRTLQEA